LLVNYKPSVTLRFYTKGWLVPESDAVLKDLMTETVDEILAPADIKSLAHFFVSQFNCFVTPLLT